MAAAMAEMNEPAKNSALLGEALLETIRQAVREEIRALNGEKGPTALLLPEELADRLKVPLSWVYEQSRQGNIPTHRLGRYIRFDLREVIESQKKGA